MIRELIRLLRDREDEPLIGLLRSYWQVITRRVRPGDTVRLQEVS